MKPKDLLKKIEAFLDDKKAQDILSLDLNGKSSIADFMTIASGSSQRHISSMAEGLKAYLEDDLDVNQVIVEGLGQSDWVLIDAGDVIIHLFKPEVRSFYSLEKIWGPLPTQPNLSA